MNAAGARERHPEGAVALPLRGSKVASEVFSLPAQTGLRASALPNPTNERNRP